jgi:hypothetical protein
MQIVPLSIEENKKLRNSSILWTSIATTAFSLLGIGVYKLLPHTIINNDKFGAYLISFIYLLLLGFVCYKIFNLWKDLQVGTKKVYYSEILNKECKQTTSTSSSTSSEAGPMRGGGNSSSSSSTTEEYSFVMENDETLKVTEKQYQQFSEGQTIQIERLSYSNTLLKISAIEDEKENLPNATKFLTEKESVPFKVRLSQNEITYLRSLLDRKIKRILGIALPIIAFLGFVLIVGKGGILAIISLIILGGALTYRTIKKAQTNFENDLRDGKQMTLLLLKAKTLIEIDKTSCALAFDSMLKTTDQSEIYQQVEANTYYWVGKSLSSKQILSLHTQDQQQMWELHPITRFSSK